MFQSMFSITTSDLCQPFWESPPIWDGTLPYPLPVVDVDFFEERSTTGWLACHRLEDAIRIFGEWPDGFPCRAWEVVPVDGYQFVERHNILRAATWDIIREVTDEEMHEARLRLYAPLAGPGLPVEDIVAEVERYRSIIGTPQWDDMQPSFATPLDSLISPNGVDRKTLYGVFFSACNARRAWGWDDRTRYIRDALLVFMAKRRGVVNLWQKFKMATNPLA